MKVEIYNGEWTRAQVAADKGRIYLFGDNLEDMASGYVPTMTQAVIRGLFNAVGIPTKKKRGYTDDCYFWDTDEDYALFTNEVAGIIYATKRRADVYNQTIVIPSGGIGTGRAATRGAFSVPGNRFKKFLDEQLLTFGPPTLPVGIIRVVNIKTYAAIPGEKFFRIDRQSPVGNPYYMKTPDMRDYVCDMYQAFFDKEMRDKADLRFHEYLGQILAAARQGNVALGCWCAPLRCHGETIKAWLEAQITDVGREMTVDTLVDAILTQVRETGEWIVYTRAGVTVESLRYKDGKYIVHHPGQSDFSLGEESARRYVRAHRDAL